MKDEFQVAYVNHVRKFLSQGWLFNSISFWISKTAERSNLIMIDKIGDVFHLPKNSGNSGWNVNGTRLFGSFHWKFSGLNGISER